MAARDAARPSGTPLMSDETFYIDADDDSAGSTVAPQSTPSTYVFRRPVSTTNDLGMYSARSFI